MSGENGVYSRLNSAGGRLKPPPYRISSAASSNGGVLNCSTCSCALLARPSSSNGGSGGFGGASSGGGGQLQLLQQLISESVIVSHGERYYHRECFKCENAKCERLLTNSGTNGASAGVDASSTDLPTLSSPVEINRHLFCNGCSIVKKKQEPEIPSTTTNNNTNLITLKPTLTKQFGPTANSIINKLNQQQQLLSLTNNNNNQQTSYSSSVNHHASQNSQMPVSSYSTSSYSAALSSSISPTTPISSWSSSGATNAVQQQLKPSSAASNCTSGNVQSLRLSLIQNQFRNATEQGATGSSNACGGLSSQKNNVQQQETSSSTSAQTSSVDNTPLNQASQNEETSIRPRRLLSTDTPVAAAATVTIPSAHLNSISNKDIHNNWPPVKIHTSKCAIVVKKLRRAAAGGVGCGSSKRSKSLPAKFSIDSLLDYLNCSMLLNKLELKKLNQYQRNITINNCSNSLSSATSNLMNGGGGGGAINSAVTNHRQLSCLRSVNARCFTNNLNQHQLSSGYNSQNHSNSSNSTSTTISQTANGNLNTNPNPPIQQPFNFYRLSLNHLPVHFVPTQCTCNGVSGSNSTSSPLCSTLNTNKAVKHASSNKAQCPLLSSSPILRPSRDDDDDVDDDLDDEDEDLDDEDEEEEEEEEDDMDVEEEEEEVVVEEEDEEGAVTESSDQTDAAPLAAIESLKSQLAAISLMQQQNSVAVSTISAPVPPPPPPMPTFQRAPGTSHCQHTAKIDIRRVRSLRDLTKVQLTFSPNDFIVKEKLGEGFFANVKKIVSKQTQQEMVLKELKLNCVTTTSTTTTTSPNENNNHSDEQISQTSEIDPNRLDLLVNYAELNAAHKSFLKEAQVLRNLDHPNVIKFIGIMFTKEKHLNLILEYISGGTLKDIIHNISNVLPWKLRVGYAKDIAAAMQYLHSLNIIHRDLKSDNCLVRENGRTVVVADFGLSRIVVNNSGNSMSSASSTTTANNKRQNYPSCCYSSASNSRRPSYNLNGGGDSAGSSCTNSFIAAAKRKLKRRGNSDAHNHHPQHHHNHHHHHRNRQQRYAVVGNSFSMAPEMLKHQIYDERVDIFSFGIICCEIIGRVQADPDYLPRTSDFGLNVELFRKKYCEADCPKQFIRIAIACCELDPEKRPPFAKTHLWLETILSHLEANNPIPKNLLKNILDQNHQRPSCIQSPPTPNN